jgi:ketosteroid isomerase-like protein
MAHTGRIAQDGGAEVVESERLARRWFAVVQAGSFEELVDLVHEDVVLVSKVRPGTVLEGRQQLGVFVAETLSDSLYEAVTDVYRPLDASRIVVEGRLRWIDEDRVIRDDPVIWAMEFRDGLLARFVPARTAVEAETILRTGSTPVR